MSASVQEATDLWWWMCRQIECHVYRCVETKLSQLSEGLITRVHLQCITRAIKLTFFFYLYWVFLHNPFMIDIWCICSFLFIGRVPTTWPADNCLQIMVCSCVVRSKLKLLRRRRCGFIFYQRISRYSQVIYFLLTVKAIAKLNLGPAINLKYNF